MFAMRLSRAVDIALFALVVVFVVLMLVCDIGLMVDPKTWAPPLVN